MSTGGRLSLPPNYSDRVKATRLLRAITQAQLADLLGVSFASVNRWENGQSRPSNLSWQRILELEASIEEHAVSKDYADTGVQSVSPPSLDFSADPDTVWALAEAHRLGYGHLMNPAFAIETSRIDPLPHQRLAVYKHMLHQSPLRFLLADDAGAGKTIMTGLYVREMLARRLIRRVLVVPPAGLVGNWEREMRNLFRLRFRIIGGADGRAGNPFSEADSDLAIVSVDTLAGERMFGRLAEDSTEAYDLVVFDEAHKLSADRQPDLRLRKTERYRLAEAIAGAGVDDERWALPWSAQHLLLLTATPHMGKDSPYYFLWRLLLPDALPTQDAFERFPEESRQRHFIRRTKEELVDFNDNPLYTKRNCDTFGYELTQGPDGEQALYDETTDYIRNYYNQAKLLNSSAARLAMSVFQRRLASSTYALLRSFERRTEKLDGLIERIRNGSLTEEHLAQQQRALRLDDEFETKAADDQASDEGGVEQQEEFEDKALGSTVATNLADLLIERDKVEELLKMARSLYDQGEESKFEKLREVLSDSRYAGEKFIIFTEHRDTAYFLMRRLEGLGFTGQVASIHGGMPYQEREQQVDFFRRPTSEQGASFLVATDAAGEGINLQFCWLMVNYDIPWNPARLEQRMGRIHRYGQTHDPVVVINLVAEATREGRVLKTLLEKLESIRKELGSDKVFDVIGRLFEGVSIKDYLEQSLSDGTDAAVTRLEGRLTGDQVRAIQDRERVLFGPGGDVRRELQQLTEEVEQESYRRLLPGYVRRFVERAASLLDLKVEGDLDATFRLVAARPRASDPLLPELERYPEEWRDRLTVYRGSHDEDSVWLHPGEPLFDKLSGMVVGRFGPEGLKGTVFADPYATEPYLFHIALVTVKQTEDSPSEGVANKVRLLESRLVGLRQHGDGSVEQCPVEHMLLLKGVSDFAPGSEPLAAKARDLTHEAHSFAKDAVTASLVEAQCHLLLADLEERVRFVSHGFDYQAADLAAVRTRLTADSREGDARASAELEQIRQRQRNLTTLRDARIEKMRAEPDTVQPGEVEFLVHALVVPSRDPGEAEQYDAEVESIAMKVATAYEETFDAVVKDVSRPELARQVGLQDWPGFDLLSRRPPTADSPGQEMGIEVKGRSREGSIEVSDNEWAKACNLRDKYWLYVVFDCATPNPRLLRIRDPFGKLLAKTRESTAYTIGATEIMDAAEE